MLVNLSRIFKNGFKNLFRNAWLTMAATLVMIITLLIVSFSVFSTLALKETVTIVKSKVDIVAFLVDGALEKDVNDLMTSIEQSGQAKSVKLISKDEALARYQEENKENPQALETLEIAGNNPFPASLEIQTFDPEKIDNINSILESDLAKKIIDPSKTQSKKNETAKKIIRASSSALKYGIMVSIIFITISILIIFNTVRMAIFSRRDEIEIMKLVGSTNGFVRGPFLVEGMLYGVIAAFICMMVILFFSTNINDSVLGFLGLASSDSLIKELLTSRLLFLGFLELVFGVSVGVISSSLATSRYLKL